MAPGPRVEWSDDEHLTVGATPYVLMNGERHADELRIFKPRIMLEAYEPVVDEFRAANIVELGLLDGGSAAYLVERCEPRRFVGIDRNPQGCPPLERFVAGGGRARQVRLHGGVDQADGARIRAIVTEDLDGEAIDLVIDDASHRYEQTVASFEALFPLVRPGGLYIIEDWTAEDWLALTFDTIIAHREPIARAIADDWLADVAQDDGNVVWHAFERWLTVALADPRLPHHDAATEWLGSLGAPGARPSAAMLDDRLRRLDLDATALAAPTLGTLGLQLLLAVKGLCSAFASLTVTPWWLAVRRGGDVPEPFTVAGVSADRLDVVASLDQVEPGRGSADRAGGDQPADIIRSTPPMMSG